MTNIIDSVLRGTGGEDMRTDDFMAFYGEIGSGDVQYGTRTSFCDYLKTYIDAGLTQAEIFQAIVAD